VAADVVGKGCPRGVEERGQAAVEEVDGLALELALPVLVALEDRSRAGSERAVVEEGDLGSSRNSRRRSSGEGAAMGLFYSIPNPHPPGDR
jgi:hypothetical protein